MVYSEDDVPLARQMSVCVVIPTYNEAPNIPQLIYRIKTLGIPDLLLLFVDDNSPDGTADLSELLGKESGVTVKVIRRLAKFGLGTAYREGFRWALEEDFNFIIQMDADLSHPPECIPKMLKLLEVYQVVIGSRYVAHGSVDKNWSWSRKLLSWFGNYAIRKIAGLNVVDSTSGFKAYRKSALNSIDFDKTKCRGFGFQVEVVYLCQLLGFKMVELPIVFLDRQVGTSKMSMGIIIEAVIKIVQMRFTFSKDTGKNWQNKGL